MKKMSTLGTLCIIDSFLLRCTRNDYSNYNQFNAERCVNTPIKLCELPYTVLFHDGDSSNPVGTVVSFKEFSSIQEALECYWADAKKEVSHIEIDGLDDEDLRRFRAKRVRKNPAHQKEGRSNRQHRRNNNQDSDDGEWSREFAMQSGMAFGVQGYNDALGF